MQFFWLPNLLESYAQEEKRDTIFFLKNESLGIIDRNEELSLKLGANVFSVSLPSEIQISFLIGNEKPLESGPITIFPGSD